MTPDDTLINICQFFSIGSHLPGTVWEGKEGVFGTLERVAVAEVFRVTLTGWIKGGLIQSTSEVEILIQKRESR